MYKPFGNLGRHTLRSVQPPVTSSPPNLPASLNTPQPPAAHARPAPRPPTPGPHCNEPATRGPTSDARPGRVRGAHCPPFRDLLSGSLRFATQQGIMPFGRRRDTGPVIACDVRQSAVRTLPPAADGLIGWAHFVSFYASASEGLQPSARHETAAAEQPPPARCPAFLGLAPACDAGRALRALPPRADLLRGLLRVATQQYLRRRPVPPR